MTALTIAIGIFSHPFLALLWPRKNLMPNDFGTILWTASVFGTIYFWVSVWMS